MWQIPELKTVGVTNSAGTAQTSMNAQPQMFSTTVKWTGMGGRARVGIALDRHKDFTSVGETDTGYAVKGGFNFGVADVGVAYEHMGYKCANFFSSLPAAQQTAASTANANAANFPALCSGSGTILAKQWAVGVSVPVGLGAIKGSFAKANDMTGPIGVDQTGAKQWLVGYEHRFSKRTSLGVEHAKIDNHRNAQFTWTGMPPSQLGTGASNTPVFGSSVTWTFVSMTHRF
jgi:predicted porin